MYEKSGAPAVWTLEGILSCSTAPGMGFAVVGSAGPGAVGAGAGAVRAGVAAVERETLAVGALRAGGATGVVAMTWISGSFVVPEPALPLGASWAATLLNPIASTPQSAQSDPHNTKIRCRCRRLNDTTYSPAACAIAHAGSLEWCHSTDACDRRGYPNRPGTFGKSTENVWQSARRSMICILYRPDETQKDVESILLMRVGIRRATKAAQLNAYDLRLGPGAFVNRAIRHLRRYQQPLTFFLSLRSPGTTLFRGMP